MTQMLGLSEGEFKITELRALMDKVGKAIRVISTEVEHKRLNGRVRNPRDKYVHAFGGHSTKKRISKLEDA